WTASVIPARPPGVLGAHEPDQDRCRPEARADPHSGSTQDAPIWSCRRSPRRITTSVQNESSLPSVSSGCVGFLRSGRGVRGPALKGLVRLDRGGSCGGGGPEGGGRPGSG